MSQSQGKKRRGRPSRGGGRVQRTPAEQQARIDTGLEDPQTFWARSNARLGFEQVQAASKSRSRPPVEFQCAVCGTFVSLEKWPKHRHDVRCEQCRQAMGGLLDDEEREAADQFRKQHGPGNENRYEGLPEMTPEDLEALADMRAHTNLGNGRTGNRKRRETRGGGGGGGGGGGQKRRREGREGGGRDGGGRDGGGREAVARERPVFDDAGERGGDDEGGRRRRRRRRRRSGGAGESREAAAGGAED